jgi:alkylation response protein AidB-like acyl-CoA dehydrogenase
MRARAAAAPATAQRVVRSRPRMAYALTDEQQELRDSVRRFCQERAPLGEARRLMETEAGYDPAVWKQMASELGLQGVAIAEDCGGQGLGFAELGIVLGELGRSLVCAPYLSSVVLAGGVLDRVAQGQQRAELLAAVAAGETFALALCEPGGGWQPEQVALEAVPEGASYRLEGAKTLVVDGASAQRLIAVARAPGSRGAEGLGAFLIDADAAGLSRAPLQSLDPTRRLAQLRLEGVRAQALGTPGEAAAGLARALDEAAVALACEMVGGIERVLEMSVAYARERIQFGRPIGSFQAIKHKCADVLIALEGARSAARAAAAALDEGSDERAMLACVAKARCGEAYVSAATENLQIHGGIGFTWEHDAHLYYRRAKSSEVLLGDSAAWRERLLARVLAGAQPSKR